MEVIDGKTKRRVNESAVGGVIIGTGVSIERLINQGADMPTVLSAGGIQCISTFLMALGCISFYDWMIQKVPGELSESIKKMAVGGFLATLSGLVNYVGQLKTQGSFEESIVMFTLSGTGLILYEHRVAPKIMLKVEENKYTILKLILNIGNTLGLK